MSTRMRCKMVCHGVVPNEHSKDWEIPMSQVSFGAVWSPDCGKPEDENAVFGKYTPSASFSAQIATAVAENLEVGRAYYFDISRAD